MKRIALLVSIVTVVGVTVGGVAGAAARPSPTTITLVAHDAFAVSKPVLASFTAQTGIKVKLLQSGDAGQVLNQAILTKDHPIGDVLFGVDNTFQGRALDAGIFEAYTPAALSKVPDEYQLDPTHHLTPVDHGDVCINYDKTWFAKHDVPVPKTLGDLTKPAYDGKLVVENPATSSPGLAFQLATIARYGENGWRAYWTKLRRNGVLAVDGWEQAYDGQFTQGGNHGTYPLVVSYASSPPAAVYYDHKLKTSPVGTMLDSCFQQVEFVGVLKGTAHRAAARKLVDFMLSPAFQADMPLQMFVFPVREGTPLPPVFQKYAEVPPHPTSLPPTDIARNRDEWIQQWTDTVLR
ncbi:MAG TPA: thiamine ABC transporter substrate-binding protein [Acidimicrobiia bacterium]|jgi:thiamine transport system substrate-binding protein